MTSHTRTKVLTAAAAIATMAAPALLVLGAGPPRRHRASVHPARSG